MTVACRPIPSYHIFPSVTSGQDPLLHTHTFSLCHMWAVQVHCWPLGCSVVGQGWPESCSTSKWRLVEIKISQSAILARTAKEKKIWNSLNHLIHPSPHLSWKCSWTGTSLSTCVPAFLWHKAKGRGWFGAGGAGPVGQGCTLLQPLLLYKEKKKKQSRDGCLDGRKKEWWEGRPGNNLRLYREGQKTAVMDTVTPTLLWNTLVLLLYTYRVRAQLHCQHKPPWWHYTGMAVHMEGARMIPLSLLWSIQWTPLPRRDDMLVCFPFLFGMTHCSYLVISRNIQVWAGHYAGADNTTQNTELPSG